MTDGEFVTWLTGHMDLFPDLKTWLLSIEEKSRRRIQEAWRDALRPVALQDAQAATQAMVSGEAEPIPAYEREYTAAKIRAAAREIASRRFERAKRRKAAVPVGAAGDGPSAGEMFSKIMALVDQGYTARQAAEQVIPKTHSLDGPRYHCSLCLDSGMVPVWSERSIKASIDGTLDIPNERHSCAAPCSCAAGDRFVWKGTTEPPKGWSGWTDAEAVFSTARHCLCRNYDVNDPENIAGLKDWTAERLLERDKRKRVAAFDAWNEGGGPVKESTDGF